MSLHFAAPPKIYEYYTVSWPDHERFLRAVTERMNDGWVLIGGVNCCIDRSGGHWFSQALYRWKFKE